MTIETGTSKERAEIAREAVELFVDDLFFTKNLSVEEIAHALAHKFMELKKMLRTSRLT